MEEFFNKPELSKLALRLLPAAGWLVILWTAETWLTTPESQRIRHALTNLSLAALNAGLLFFSIGLLSVAVCSQHAISPVTPPRFAACLIGLDLFSYAWHRLNHTIPFLWRFHAVHHSDAAMDVTTAARFHVGELAIGGILRLPVLSVLSVPPSALVGYETLLLLVSMFHHSRLRLGRWSRLLNVVIVTPELHSVHHSRNPEHAHHNFASVLSIWDRLFRSFRFEAGPLQHGLPDSKPGGSHSIPELLAAPWSGFRRIAEPEIVTEVGLANQKDTLSFERHSNSESL